MNESFYAVTMIAWPIYQDMVEWYGGEVPPDADAQSQYVAGLTVHHPWVGRILSSALFLMPSRNFVELARNVLDETDRYLEAGIKQRKVTHALVSQLRGALIAGIEQVEKVESKQRGAA